MQMTPEEIRGRYSRAENKRESVKILAELNGTDEQTIRSILEKGEEPEKPSDTEGKKLMSQKERAELIRTMLTAEKPVNQIAEAAGCSEETVRNHAKKLKLEAVAATEAARPAEKEKPIAAKEWEPTDADRVADIIMAVPENAAKETKLRCYELCRSMLKNAVK